MSRHPSPSPTPPRGARGFVVIGLKLAVMAAVVLAVLGTLKSGISELRLASIQLDWRWCLAGGVAYLLGLLPMACFWRSTLRQLEQPCQWGLVIRAYYLGHLGKYVPGKAMVILLRAAAIRSAGGQTSAITISVFIETLTFMAVGGLLAGVLLACSPELTQARPWLLPLAVLLSAVSVGPTIPPVMNWLIVKFRVKQQAAETSPENQQASPTPIVVPQVTWRLLALGWGSAAATWCGLALSLGFFVFSVGGDKGSDALALLSLFPSLLLAATLPVVAGFLSLLPGGLLVRDGLMTELLAPALGAGPALAVAVLSRVIWLAGELLICGILEIRQRLIVKVE